MPLTDNAKVPISQIAKHPLPYALSVIVGLLMYFVTKFGNSSDLVNQNCEKEKTELRKELVQARADKDALTTALLVKNGIILKQAEEQASLDSTIKNKLGTKAKQILKER